MIIAAKVIFTVAVSVAFIVILYCLEEGRWPWEKS